MIHDKVFALIWLWHCFIVVMGVVRLLTRSPQLVSAEVRIFIVSMPQESRREGWTDTRSAVGFCLGSGLFGSYNSD